MASCVKTYVITILILLFPSVGHSAYKYNSHTGTRDYCIEVTDQSGSVTNSQCETIKFEDGSVSKESGFFLIKAGAAVGGYVSMTTSTSTVDISYSYIRKEIATDPAFQTGTLPDGNIGKLLTIEITAIESPGDTWTLTPDTSFGIDTIVFSKLGEIVTLLYIDDTNGWIKIQETKPDNTVVVSSDNYDLSIHEEIVYVDTDSGVITVNLPPALNGNYFKIINAGSSGNSVYVSQGAGINIMGYGVSMKMYDGEILDLHYNSIKGWF